MDSVGDMCRKVVTVCDCVGQLVIIQLQNSDIETIYGKFATKGIIVWGTVRSGQAHQLTAALRGDGVLRQDGGVLRSYCSSHPATLAAGRFSTVFQRF